MSGGERIRKPNRNPYTGLTQCALFSYRSLKPTSSGSKDWNFSKKYSIPNARLRLKMTKPYRNPSSFSLCVLNKHYRYVVSCTTKRFSILSTLSLYSQRFNYMMFLISYRMFPFRFKNIFQLFSTDCSYENDFLQRTNAPVLCQIQI